MRADVPTRYDLVVVGAGVAGLIAANELRNRSLLVLEEAEIAGGRTYSEALPDGQWFNLGAQWLTESIARLAQEHGVDVKLDRLPPPALILKGKRVIETNPVLWFLKLPFAPRARYDFLRMAVRLKRELKRRDRRARELEAITLAEWLGPIHPDIAGLIEMWASVSGSRDPSQVSALAGLDTVGAAVGQMKFHGASYHVVEGGTGKFAGALGDRLGDRLLTGAKVTRVREGEDGVTITFRAAGGEDEVVARQCILAIPPNRAREAFDGIPPAGEAALDALIPAKVLGAGIVVEGAAAAPWDDMYWMRTPGPTMSNLFNANFFSRANRPPAEPRALSCLCTGTNADYAWTLSDEEVAASIEREFEEVFPEARGHVRVARIRRWSPAYFSLPPGTGGDAAARAVQAGRVQLCGDYVYGIGIEHAVHAGREAAARALARLDVDRVSA